jgi:hypothetical protein
MCWSHQAADHGYAAGFSSNAVRSFPIVLNERGTLDKIAGWITTNRELWEKNEARALGSCAMSVVDDFPCVAGEISDDGVDLPQTDLHRNSVKG